MHDIRFRFMWGLHTANEDHWVPISTIASFKRMKEFTSLGVEGIAKALRELSQDLEVDDTGTQVRRKHEVQEPKDQFQRSIYAVCPARVLDVRCPCV
jgi:lupus La protein